MKKVSLVHQMIAGVLLAELLCAALLSSIALWHEMNERLHAFDVMLRGRADSVLGAIRDSETPNDDATVDPSELQLPKQDIFLVLDPSGRVLGQSPGLSKQSQQSLSQARIDPYFQFRVGEARYRAVRRQGVRVIDRDDHGGIRRPVLIIYAAPTRFLWHEALEAVRFYVIAGIVLLGITGGALAWFLRRRLSPLEELAAVAARVSPGTWEFVPPKAVMRTRELAPISTSIEQLLKSLRAAFDRQRQLTGDAAHELKTSIAVLKSSLQLLALAPRTTREYEQGLEGLLLDTERTEALATRMLALARLEETPAECEEVTDLSYTLVAVVERLRPLAELKHIQVASKIEAETPVSMAADDAEILCSNLLMNALQHTDLDGQISVSVTNKGDESQLRIVDDGEGIPAAALPHVFERFYRADTSRSRKSGGAGLGLSICKAIVERVSGSIDVRSTVSVGTEVIVTLPIATEVASSAAKPPIEATAL